MATPDDDTTTQTAPPPPAASPDIDYKSLIQQILQGGGGISGPAAPSTPAVNPNLPITSLLGEAFGGGVSPLYPMSEAQQTQAGNAALLNFGIGMLQNSSGPVRHSLGQAIASGLLGAQGSLAGVREGQAQTLDVQNKQQTMGLEKIKTALSLLQLQTRQGLPSPFAQGTGPGSGGGAPGGNLAATGAPIAASDAPVLQRDPSIKVAGDQANNPGNLMYVRGQPGVSGQLPLSGGRTLAAFPDMPTGIAANANQLMLNQDQHGINTVRGMVSRWVGDPKADLGSYTADVSKALGVDPDAPVDFHNPDVLSKFIAAQRPHESGPAALNPADVTKGVGMALAARSAPPGGTRTATAPSAATKPPTASTAPPGVQMGGAVPPPPGGAPGATATPYPVAGSGIGRVLTGTQGVAGPQQVTVAPPPALGKGSPIPAGKLLPRVAGDVGAIQQGVNLAQATPIVPGTGLAAGPTTIGKPATTAPAPASAWPATTTTIGNYNGTTATPAPAPVTPPAQPTPAQPAQLDLPNTPDQKLTPEQYVLKHWTPLTPEEVGRYAPGPENQMAVDRARQVQQAQADANAARSTYLNVQRGVVPGDLNKSLSDMNTADARVDAAEKAYNEAVQGLQTSGAKNLLDADSQQRQQLRADYKSIVTDPATAAALKTQEGEQAQTLARINAGTELEKGDADQGRKDIDALNTNAMAASNMQSLLGMIGPQLKDLPSATVGAMLQDHPGAIPFLTKLHLLDGPTANATQLLQGLTAFMATEMKPKGLGPLRIQEMNAFQGALPNLLQSDEGRQKAFAFMNAYTQRIMDEADFSQKYFMRDKPNQAPNAPPGSTVPARNTYGMWSTIGKPVDQGGLGSVLPMYTGGTSTLDDGNKYATWERQQQAKPGNAYWQLRRNPNTGGREMQLAVTPPAGGR